MKKILDVYRDKYEYYNEDTLQQATIDHPEWLKKIILNLDIKSFARSFSVYHLAIGAREEYFNFIKSYVFDPCPFMREAAFMGLFQYHATNSKKYPELKTFFLDCLNKETGVGVRQKIESLVESMEFYTDMEEN